MELRRILVPYDFSEASGHAARYACDLATHFRAEITVMHVLPPLRYEFAMTQPTDERMKDVNEQRMANAQQALESIVPGWTASEPVRIEVLEGDAAEEIIAAANNNGHYDVVVMSTRGAGLFRRWFIIGSVTSKVLHGVERPVITSVHFEKHESPVPVRRVLCAVDLGPQSRRVLCWGLQAARNFDAALAVVHAAPLPEGEEDEGSRKTGAAKRLIEKVDQLKRDLHVQAETVVEFGDPARTISEIAREHKADLLVLGRGVSQDLIGRLRANAYDIIRQCPCPVVSI